MSDKSKFNEETPKNSVGGKTVKPSAWRKLLAKKWAAPTAFLAAAAIIVTLMWLYGGAGETSNKPTSATVEDSQGTVTDDQPVVSNDDPMVKDSENEVMQWPTDRNQVDVVAGFYDEKASNEERQAAMIQSGNTFMANMGIDLAKNDQPFDVKAALSGRVIVAEKHPLNGNMVEIKHADGVVTIYNSLSDLQVKVGDEVKQGTVIAKAGRSELEKDLGVHLHFEVRKDGKAVNPNTLLTSAEN
ncbi:stage II sporulation protein Q [Paenibacillus taihuensis]|uniref:Stage II sporulation protein Q n=1 Tax=Paenibacillus taihuensis TaxID=1156355 RepID=A0A3D9SC65_9BACL|nr:M23 family metallopeptidase [Paenibacillus taihuensis]REE91471.1 stage II sporulation protein Q [Paenibacillus taihuensis]